MPSILTTTLLLLLGIFALSGFLAAYRRLPPKELAQTRSLGLSLLHTLGSLLWTKEKKAAHFIFLCSLNVLRFSYAASIVCWIFLAPSSLYETYYLFRPMLLPITLLSLFAFSFLLGDYLPKVLVSRYPAAVLRYSATLSSLYIFLLLPISWPLYLLCRRIVQLEMPAPAGHELLEMIEQLHTSSKLELHDKKLIESVVDFRHKLAKEVMVPRVEIFSLPATLSIREAAKLLDPEGYSRIPVYHSSIDEISGVLMQKDILRNYMESESKRDFSLLELPVSTIIKEVIFTPETKPISVLLQEFRSKKVHMAIVVDEYGGTEGIVTIEDILEQIVGEIADEYDQEEPLFTPQVEGGWIVDAKMSLLDVKEMLDISIPEEGDYDTLAGFVFHCAGSIPSKGFIIHRDNLEITVLSSNDRMVEKVWLKPTCKDRHLLGKI